MTESKKKIQEVKVKTFKDLEEEVVNRDRCVACGACVSYCEVQAFDVITMKENRPQFKSQKNEENCTECGVCYYSCPQTEPILSQVEERYDAGDNLGHIIDFLAAKTMDSIIEKHGQDGGVVSTILRYLFEEREIDGAIVSEYDENLIPIPKIIFDEKEIINSAGTRYSISPQMLPLKDIKNISADILREKGIYNIDAMRLAFVGTPCQLRALRKMHFLNITPAHLIKYGISLFCFENFNHEQLYDILTRETHLTPSQMKKTYIKNNFFIQSKTGEEHEIEIKKLDSAVRSHCLECVDFTGKYSDISVGSSGAPKGYSMIIIRTQKGKELIDAMLKKRYIEEYPISLEELGEWREKKLKNFNRMVSLKSKKKRNRTD